MSHPPSSGPTAAIPPMVEPQTANAMARYTSLRAFLSQWSSRSQADGPRNLARCSHPVLLLNYTHLDTDTPYRASHAICVREHAAEAEPAPGDVPFAIRRRLISARLFDAPGNIVGSDVFEGTQLAGFLSEGFQREDVAYAHIHYARNGCFAAKAVRA